MMVRLAALAPTSPPDTGASTQPAPAFLIFLANSLVASGAIDDMSMTSLPFRLAEATPSAPNRTSSTCGVSGTMVMMISALAATALGVAAKTAPPLARSLGMGFLRLSATIL